MRTRDNSGFTLIELLVVIAIIGILSSIVLVSLNSARTKAQNTQRIAELREISKALNAYFADNGQFPPSPYPSVEVYSSDPNFLPELVAGGYMKVIPQGPVTDSYAYYRYAAGGPSGALLRTILVGDPLTTTGRVGSCRPFDNNWCSYTQASTDYCLCNPY